MHAQRAPDETRQRVRREAWTWALTLSLLAVALLWWGLASRANLQQRERDRLAGQARAVELNLARNVEGVHAALRFLRDEAASWPVGQQAATLGGPMQALRDAMPGVQALLWLDANGRVLASSQAALVGTDLERVPFYSALRDQPDPALLVISGPQPEGAQGPVLNLALVVPPASARFGGALVARLDASFFSTVLDSVRYADDMQADVVHAGGTVLVASPPSAGVRSRAQPDTPFMQHRESGLQESVRLGQMPGQAGVRLVAQRNFRPTTAPMDGLVLSVSRALDDVREPWQRQVAIAAMAFLALLGGSWQAMRLLQRRRHEMVALASERAAQQAAHADQLALALRGADLALWDAELPGGRMSVNERWFTMIGLQPGEVTPDNEAWQSRLHPEDKVAVLAALQSHLQGQSASFEATYRLRHRDGHWVWILDRARVVDRDPAGVPRRMVGTHMDVSAGMQSREALRDREAQLSSMADALPGPVARLDREGRYLFVNATYERWFGLRPHEMLGRRRDEVLAAHAIERLAPQIERALAGESITLDSVAPTLQGARQVMVALVPDRDAHGAVQGCFVVVTDITVRKQAEDALRLSEQKSRALLEALRSGVMVYAADTSLRDANPAACHILGERLEDMRGRRANDAAWDFLDEDGSPLDPERHPVSRVVASGQPLRDRVMGVRRAGEAEPGWMLCSAFPLYGESGILLEVVVAMADFTERKLAVEALRRSESRWRLAGRLARLGGWHYEAPQGPLAFSTELGELLGAGGLHALTPDEARQLLPGASNERWQHQIEACLVGGAAFDVELEASSVDGRLVHLRVLGEGIRDAGNRLIAVEGAVQDITERKLGEASLRAAQSELAATLAAVPDLLFDVDLRGRIFAQHSPNTQLLLMSPASSWGACSMRCCRPKRPRWPIRPCSRRTPWGIRRACSTNSRWPAGGAGLNSRCRAARCRRASCPASSCWPAT
jgi:PAS domain S-box-containing protein